MLDEKIDEGLLRLSFDDINVQEASSAARREHQVPQEILQYHGEHPWQASHPHRGKKDIEDTGKVINELHGIVKKGFL
jgi:hypothetical protein